jgi:hypothetical protein
MKAVISVASVLACALSLDAQITATLNRLPDGLDEVRIRNNSATSLAAFVVSVKQAPRSAYPSNGPFGVYSDPSIDPANRPLLASEERVVMTMKAMAAPGWDASGKRLSERPIHVLEEPIVTAGVFADGSTTGDATLLTRLMLRRSNMLLAVETALETLSDAGRRNVSRDRLIEQFRKMADSVRRWYVPPEQQVGRSLYQSIIEKLMNLSEGEVGSPFPPANFVEQETAMLNRQRVTLLESQPSLVDAFGQFFRMVDPTQPNRLQRVEFASWGRIASCARVFVTRANERRLQIGAQVENLPHEAN